MYADLTSSRGRKESAVAAALREMEEGGAAEGSESGGSGQHEHKEESKGPNSTELSDFLLARKIFLGGEKGGAGFVGPARQGEVQTTSGLRESSPRITGAGDEETTRGENMRDVLAHRDVDVDADVDVSADGSTTSSKVGSLEAQLLRLRAPLSVESGVSGRVLHSVKSAVSGRAQTWERQRSAEIKEGLSPVGQDMRQTWTFGGHTRKSDLALKKEAVEVPCMGLTGKGRGLPLASLVEEAVEEALGGGAGPPDTVQDNFEDGSRLFRGVWELTYLIVMGSILFFLWAYEGRSPSVPDLITVVVSAAGSLGIVARAFSARGYIGVMYRGQVGSGIVDVHLISAGKLDSLFRRFGVCQSQGIGRKLRDLVVLVLASPIVALLALSSLTTIVHYVFHLVVGSENNGSWGLGTGILRYRDKVVVLPFMEKRIIGIDYRTTRRTRWPGGALRAYHGGPVEGPWALHFSSRDSFLAELGCDRLFLQFGVERRLVCESGSRVLSFVIAMRDTRGGLLLIPVGTSGGVRVRVGALPFSGATGGVTIMMDMEYPERAPYPEEMVAEKLKLNIAPFCLDVSSCGIGAVKTTDSQVNMFSLLDGAGVGGATDVCPLWECLSDMCLGSLAASWAAGYFGGNFHTLHEYGIYGTLRVHKGRGKGRRCVVSTPPLGDPGKEYDVVVGVRAHGRGMRKIPVDLPGEDAIFRSYRHVQRKGISGKYCLIPAGPNATWEYGLGGVAEHLGKSEECLVA